MDISANKIYPKCKSILPLMHVLESGNLQTLSIWIKIVLCKNTQIVYFHLPLIIYSQIFFFNDKICRIFKKLGFTISRYSYLSWFLSLCKCSSLTYFASFLRGFEFKTKNKKGPLITIISPLAILVQVCNWL